MASDSLVLLAILLPALGAAGILAAGRWPDLREGVTLGTAGVTFLVVLELLGRVLAGERPAAGGWPVFGGVEIGFAVEPLGMLFGTIASGLWIVNSIYSIGYMRGNDEPRQTPYYICFAVAIASALGVAFAGNLVTLFLAYEVLTLSTYPLVAHKGDDEAKAKARIYLVLLLATSMMLMLPAIVWTGVAAGTLDFAPGGILAGAGLGTSALGLLLLLYIFGIGKAAVMPVHFWLPAAMVAPTPVSALLHAVAVVKAGVFTVVKVIVYVFGVEHLSASGAGDWLVYLAGFTVIGASIVALMQDNLKLRLAYSTVSQLSYVILAAAILTPVSMIGAALHIAAHAVSKITLFFCAGSIYTAAHLTNISELDGVGRRMPWTMGAFAIGSLSMIGVPPTAGFVSKWFMLEAGMGSGNFVAVAVILLSTALNAAYFLPVVYKAFFNAPPQAAKAHPAHGEGPVPVVLALTVTALLTIGVFFFPDVPYSLAEAMAVPPEAAPAGVAQAMEVPR
jgi:multicomponent Na+:H+ antiporter subunit D